MRHKEMIDLCELPHCDKLKTFTTPLDFVVVAVLTKIAYVSGVWCDGLLSSNRVTLLIQSNLQNIFPLLSFVSVVCKLMTYLLS